MRYIVAAKYVHIEFPVMMQRMVQKRFIQMVAAPFKWCPGRDIVVPHSIFPINTVLFQLEIIPT